MPYRILEHGASKHRAIKCLRRVNGRECGGISYHPRHVAERHCPVCKYFHPEPTGEVVPVWEDAAMPKINPNLSFIFYD
jgi:hypothetical protein